MLKATYYQNNEGQGGKYDLPEWLFDGVINEDVLHQVIRVYLLNQRQGNAAAKSRGQVAGGSSKPWRQKGTGRARQGTIRAVQWAGGGVAFVGLGGCISELWEIVEWALAASLAGCWLLAGC